jgi:spore coat polysaccharide biosynthesis protein SpsF
MKILAIIQARMGSERLPGKVIKSIMNKPMIIYTLERLKKSRYIDEIILATSSLDKDNKLEDVAVSYGFNVFRGEENNVLKRYKEANDMHNGDIIIRITGDCPFIDPLIVDEVICYYLINNFDYVRLDVPDSFIRGFDVEVFSKASLENTYSSAIDEQYKEHVTLYMYKHPEKFKVGYFKGTDFYNKNYRLCVDTPEDFEVVKKIYEHFNDEYVSSKAVVKYLDENPQIACINLDIIQKDVK